MKSRRSAAPTLLVAEPRPLYAERPPLVVDCSLLCALLFDEPLPAYAFTAKCTKNTSEKKREV